MSTNGKWFHTVIDKKPYRINPGVKSGWFAAVPSDCNRCVVKVFIYPNHLDCVIEGREDLKYDVYDFDWWYPLNGQHDRLPEFRE